MKEMLSEEKAIELIKLASNELKEKRKARGVWWEGIRIRIAGKHKYSGKYVFIWDGKKDELTDTGWALLSDLALESWNIQRYTISVVYNTITFYLVRDPQYQSNITADVIEALKESTHSLIGLYETEDNKKVIENNIRTDRRNQLHYIVSYISFTGPYGNGEWVLDGKELGKGKIGAQKMLDELSKVKDRKMIYAWYLYSSGSVRIDTQEMKYSNIGSITGAGLNMLESLINKP